MKVIDPGHVYELDCLDEVSGWAEELRFVKRIGDKFPGNEPPGFSGTTTQEVLRALIDRTKYVDAQIDHTDQVSQKGHATNARVIKDLRNALVELEMRAAYERGDGASMVAIATLENPEDAPTCDHCGHIGCERKH